MTKYTPARMIGRIDRATSYIMAKYGLSAPEGSSLIGVLRALPEHVNGRDITLCEEMAAELEVQIQNLSSLGLGSEEFVEQKALGQSEADYIFKKYPAAYFDKVLADYDYYGQMELERLEEKKQARRKFMIIGGIIAAVIIGVIIYNLPYFAEMRKFHEVEDVYNEGITYKYTSIVDEYLAEYPNGRHLDEVLILPVRQRMADGEVIYTLEAVDRYLEYLPDGEYAAECRDIINQIWADEIAKYEAKAAEHASKDGARFVMEMLKYMQAHNLRTIDVVAEPELQLKEYGEYPLYMRELLEYFYNNETSQTTYLGKAELPKDMVTIKDKVTDEEAKSWVEYVVRALNNGFNGVLTPGFISFRDITDAPSSARQGSPLVNVRYIVTTQEDKGYPEIWIYTQTMGQYSGMVTSKKFVLGIGMTFDADFTLPGTDISYVVTGVGDPGSQEIKDQTPSTVYAVMCQRCTSQFGDKIAEEFGLEDSE